MTTNYIKLNELVGKIKQAYLNAQTNSTKAVLEDILPELAESEDERVRKALIDFFNRGAKYGQQTNGVYDKDIVAWLEKQGEQKPIINVPSREVILAIWDLGNEWKELTNGSISTEYGTQLYYIQKHWHESEYYLQKKQGEQILANSYCQEHCKGFQETGKCFADGDCKAKTIAETVHTGTENILNELASRIESAEIVNVRQVLEWIEEQTKE